MIDYELKSQVIKSGLNKRIKHIDNAEYKKYSEGIIDHNAEQEYFDLCNQYGLKMIQEARKINLASYRRVKRLRDRIIKYLNSGVCTFITLTFKDDVLNETNEKTRRKYVSRALKSLSSNYCANIDYGQDDKYTHREHYHAIAVGLITQQHLREWQASLGYTWCETIPVGSATDSQLAKYISKLTNHAIKISTRRCVYIYSRDN